MGNNIAIPNSTHIAGGVTDKSEVTIFGRTRNNFSRFSINLCVGPNLDTDCAFHFNPRFEQGQVVRNHCQNKVWGFEEKTGSQPFGRGMNFDIHLKVIKNGYKVTVNGRHFCDFNHRIPKEKVKYLYITGDVDISRIETPEQKRVPKFERYGQPAFAPPPYTDHIQRGVADIRFGGGGFVAPAGGAFAANLGYPSDKSASYPFPGYPSAGATSGSPMYNPPTPLVTPIPGGLQPGKIIYISGVPRPNASRMTMSLTCGPNASDDVVFAFDARFNFGSDHNQIVRNHKERGSWGGEERHINFFPFSVNASFELMILAEQNCFKIAVNGQHFTEFCHRLHMNRATYLIVERDLNITQVHFQ